MNILKKNKVSKINLDFLTSFKICIFAAIILHSIFFVIFFVEGIKLLMVFNIFSVSIYIIIAKYLMKKHLVVSSIITFLEVSVHSILCTYLIGWQGGFYVYPLCLIPVTYFMAINVLKKDIYGHIIVITTLLSYQLLKSFSDSRVALYQERFKDLDKVLYNFNTICASVFFGFLVYAFLNEMRHIQENLEKMNEIFKNMANIDPLTNISNRRCMDERIKLQIEKFDSLKIAFCIAICDIDDFKKINDTYGHDCGDLVLKGISNILKENANIFNIEVCRWGGEEFLILLKNCSIKNAENICEKILNDIRNYNLLYENYNIKITMTIGISEFNIQNNDIEEVLRIADMNLYKGKKGTKNCIITN